MAVEEKLAVSESESDAPSETEAEITDNDGSMAQTSRSGKKVNEGRKTKHRVIRQLTESGTPEEVTENRRKAFGSARIPLYLELCDILGIEIQPDARQKQDLHDAIVEAVCVLSSQLICNDTAFLRSTKVKRNTHFSARLSLRKNNSTPSSETMS